ncbi:hypothetical protein VNO77_25777 [Canavalia gladiata]|uniref:Uncharacterized protein n=1 Tax=Canavalia gladiata TaxID=3824 RepID=A0AAN9Q916_CANGL
MNVKFRCYIKLTLLSLDRERACICSLRKGSFWCVLLNFFSVHVSWDCKKSERYMMDRKRKKERKKKENHDVFKVVMLNRKLER